MSMSSYQPIFELIPPITDPSGKHWVQPVLSDLRLTEDGYILMPKIAFDMLAEYSCTLPSGVYPGKMWKREDRFGWHLCWYGLPLDRDPTQVSIHWRPIILKEMFDLLGLN